MTGQLQKAWQDVKAALRQPRLWVALAWRDVRVQYERALIGPFWLTLHAVAWIGAIVFVFAGLMGELKNYAVYVSIGIVLYNFITTIITDSSDLFVKNRLIIHSHPIPFFSIFLKQVVVALIQLGFQSLTVIAVFIITGTKLTAIAWLALPGLILGILAALALVGLIALIGLRHGDFRFFLLAGMRLGLFVTPILWPVDPSSPVKYWVAQLNPLSHFINLVRMPLMGQIPPQSSYLVAGGLILLLGLLAGRLFVRQRATIPMWL